MKIKVKYCGGCNAMINRKQLVAEIAAQLTNSNQVQFTQDEGNAVLVVCGCPAACVDLDQITAKKLILVSGNHVNYFAVPQDQMVNYICQLLEEDQ